MTTNRESVQQGGEEEPIFSLEDVIPVRRNGRVTKYSTTITVGRLGELLDDERIVVDYDYQRGYRTTYGANGTERRAPMVDRDRVNEIAGKILDDQLFGGSLTWSLRKGEVDFQYEAAARVLHILNGKPTIPDSNHRHQAMLRVFNRVRETGHNFDLNGYEFPLLIEVLDLNEERALFYEYNQLGKPANPTRSRYINQADPHSALTSQVITLSHLDGHVEVVTNNLSKNSPKIVTFNALATAIKAGFPELDDSNFDDIQEYLVEFIDRLAVVRPETGYLPLSQRRGCRESLIGDSAVAFYGYGMLAADLRNYEQWQVMLSKLSEPYRHISSTGQVWEGDLMSRENPVWKGVVLLQGRAGNLQISNNRETRQFIHEKLREVAGVA